jgi:hypothetical protein
MRLAEDLAESYGAALDFASPGVPATSETYLLAAMQ